MEPESTVARIKGGKGREAFRTISEVAEYLDLPQHVLRFWESKFAQIKPLKRGGNRRYYRPDDVTLLSAIKKLLHTEGYTIRGVQKLFKAQGLKATISFALGDGEGITASEEAATEHRVESAVNVDAELSGVVVSQLQNILHQLKSIRARLD